MKRLLIIAFVAALAVFATAPLAWAELPSGCVIAHECGPGNEEVYAQWLPPGTPWNTPGIWAWSPVTETVEYTGLYGLAVMCENQGGYYYYETADGGYAWNAC